MAELSHAQNIKNNPGAKPAHVRPDPQYSFVAREVAQDFSVEVCVGEEGGGSYANTETKQLVLDPKQIADRKEGLFTSAHEGGHIADTPSQTEVGMTRKEREEVAKKIGLAALSNVIEDGAVNDRFNRDFRDLRECTLHSYERVDHSKPLGAIVHPEVEQWVLQFGFVPRYAVALAGILGDWSELRHEHGFEKPMSELRKERYRGAKAKDPDVAKAIQRMLPNARDTIAMICKPGAARAERIDVGRARYFMCRDALYPELQKLVQADLQQVAQKLAEQLGSGGQKKDAGKTPEGNGAPGEGTNGKPDKANAPQSGGGSGQPIPIDPELMRQALEALGKFDDALRKATDSIAKPSEIPSAGETITTHNAGERKAEEEAREAAEFASAGRQMRQAFLQKLDPYHRIFFEVASDVDAAYGRLNEIFIPRAHFTWRPGMPVGTKVDMVKGMGFVLTGFGAEKMFMQRIDPTKPDVDGVILIDRSGSMGGEKIEAARRATVFTKELFVRLSFGVSCIAFADSSDTLIGFDDNPQDEELSKKMIEELTANGGTCDGKAVNAATRMLLRRPTKNKAIIVISDAGSSEAERLKRAVARAIRYGIAVLHFGIGAGTADSKGCYTRSFGNLEPSGGGERSFLNVFCREMERLALDGFEWEEALEG